MGKELRITTRDRLLRAWQNSTELVRDYQNYSDEVEEEKIKKLFAHYAEDEALHASELLELLHAYPGE